MTSTRLFSPKNSLCLLLVSGLLFAGSSLHAQRDIEIAPVDVTASQRAQFPVLIVSDSPELKQLAEMAFNSHGAFRVLRDRNGASFIFTFRPAGGNSVALEITSGSGAHRQTVQGTDLKNALFRAADVAVLQTTKQPGYFAGRLAFVGERTGHKEVYVGDLFLTEVTQVTNDRSQSVGPRWAPNGQRVLYTSYFQSGFPDIFQVDLISRQRTPFVSMRGTNTGARFSPDGNRIAMVLSGEGTPEVYVSNSAGRQIRRVTRTNAVQSSPTWSPDGTQLAFTSDRDGRPQIFVAPAGGGTMRRLPTNISGYCAEPDWNPRHANLLAFTVAQGGRFVVAVYDFNTRQSKVVTQGTGDAIEPVWTVDGRHLVYTARTATSSNLMLLDTHTGKTTPLGNRNMGRASHADFWIQR